MKRYNPKLPFPKIVFKPGVNEHPKKHPNQTICDPMYDDLSFNDAWLFAIDLFNQGYYWETHELLERYWLSESDQNTKMLLQIMIQLASLAYKKETNGKGGVKTLTDNINKKLKKFNELNITHLLGLSFNQISTLLQDWERIDLDNVTLVLSD